MLNTTSQTFAPVLCRPQGSAFMSLRHVEDLLKIQAVVRVLIDNHTILSQNRGARWEHVMPCIYQYVPKYTERLCLYQNMNMERVIILGSEWHKGTLWGYCLIFLGVPTWEANNRIPYVRMCMTRMIRWSCIHPARRVPWLTVMSRGHPLPEAPFSVFFFFFLLFMKTSLRTAVDEKKNHQTEGLFPDLARN